MSGDGARSGRARRQGAATRKFGRGAGRHVRAYFSGPAQRILNQHYRWNQANFPLDVAQFIEVGQSGAWAPTDSNKGPTDRPFFCGSTAMNDRTAELEAAVRATGGIDRRGATSVSRCLRADEDSGRRQNHNPIASDPSRAPRRIETQLSVRRGSGRGSGNIALRRRQYFDKAEV